MTKRKENQDELRAQSWLSQQGYNDIQRPHSDPPDFVVDGKYAVEVTRLGQRIMVGDDTHSKDEKEARERLRGQIEKILCELGPPGNKGKSWLINCEYDFTQLRPNTKDIKPQIFEALNPLLKPYDDRVISGMLSKYMDYRGYVREISGWNFLHFSLECGIRLELIEISEDLARFSLCDVSDGEGIFIAGELKKSIQNRICDKSEKIRKQNRIEEYMNWWLVLLDHVCHVPMQSLAEHELSSIREQDFDFWSRVVIVSSENQSWHYDLLPR